MTNTTVTDRLTIRELIENWAIWRDAGEVHDLRNVGNATYRNILVEVKPR